MQSPERFAAGLVRQGARALAVATVQECGATNPELLVHGLPATFADPVEDTRVRLLTLAEALDVDRPELFAHQLGWYKVALAHRSVAADYLDANLVAMRTALRQELPPACHAAVERHLQRARVHLAAAPTDLPSHLADAGPLRDAARRCLLAMLENRRHDAIEILLAQHAAGHSVADLHDHLLVPVQREVGRMWLMAEIPIADEHFVSQIVRTCIDRLAALAPRAPRTGRTVLTFAVGGNLHDLPIRLVAERFEMSGWDAWHLGADMPVEDLEWALQDRRVDVIAISAALALHVGGARVAIERLRGVLAQRCPPILVGGGPFTVVPDLHRVIGADAVADDAAGAVARAEALVAAR